MDCVTFDIIGEFYEELNEIFWINFRSGGKKYEILREYYWESNMRAKVNQFTYNALIYYPTFKAFNPAFIYLIFIPSLSEMDNIKQEIHVR